jgi:tRNA(Ile)-lysidine synthase
MQFIRGAGINELFGMNKSSSRNNYLIKRPLLDLSKKQILNLLNEKKINYFYDDSNDNTKFTRNYFRHTFTEKLLNGNEKGILKTFNILDKERKLLPSGSLVFKNEDFVVFNVPFSMASSLLSKLLKEKGYLLSGDQRNEFEESEELTVSSKNFSFVASYRNEKLYLSPYIKDIVMEKSFKEIMRKEKIPPKHRPYLYQLK